MPRVVVGLVAAGLPEFLVRNLVFGEQNDRLSDCLDKRRFFDAKWASLLHTEEERVYRKQWYPQTRNRK